MTSIADTLTSWHQQYLAENGELIEPSSDVIKAVQSDKLEKEYIEEQVKQLISTTKVENGYCTTCQHLLDHWPNLAGPDVGECVVGRRFYTSEVEAATRLGCRFCSFLLFRLSHESLLETFQKLEARLRVVGDPGIASMSIQEFWGLPHSTQFLWLNFPGKTTHHVNDTSAQAVSFVAPVIRPTAKLWKYPIDSFEVAKMWIARCASSHQGCDTKIQHKPPTRLVSVGHDNVHLVLTAELPTIPPYATLSYCWGTEPFSMLTLDTLGRFMDSIPLDELPKTFIDAIEASRRLGIDYIWIDALCIIQNEPDNSDWRREAGSMSSVYGGTLVTLAAASARSVQDGFLHKVKNYNGGFVARITTSEYSRVQSFEPCLPYNEATLDVHLTTRAWAFQERVLSPRTIYFSEAGLFWECRTQLCSEYLPDGFKGLMRGVRLAVPEDQPLDWVWVVDPYSKAELTYASDRLPALSGIAQRQQRVTGDVYLAGMWRKYLEYQLLWLRRGEMKPRPAWRAPTWSWMSIEGGVSWTLTIPTSHEDDLEGQTVYMQVLKASTLPCGPDPYGQITDGEIIVSGIHLLRGYMVSNTHREEQSQDLIRIEGHSKAFPVQIDCLEDVSTQSDDVVFLLPIIEGATGTCYIIDDQIEDPQYAVRGLVLRVYSSAKTPRCFQRIGCFAFYNWSGSRTDTLPEYQDFMNILEGMQPLDEATDIMETVATTEDGHRRHIIVIK